MTKNEKILIALFIGAGILIFLLCSHIIVFPCLFKRIFGISCPGCGLTRAFSSFFKGNFLESFSYHILGIPLCFLGILFCMLIVYDVIFHDHVFEKLITWMFGHWPWLLGIVLFAWIINLWRGI